MPTVNDTEHFSVHELKCRCGCDYPGMNEGFMRRLELIRRALDKPLTVNSAYRCPNYNGEVSDTGPNGLHTTGRAIDIALAGAPVWELLSLATQMGMKGIGLKQHGEWSRRFVHLDDLDTEYARPRVWTYV